MKKPLHAAPSVPLAMFQPALEWPTELAQAFMQTQQLHCQMLQSWLGSLYAFQKEAWDEWACRWAGGVPIDG